MAPASSMADPTRRRFHLAMNILLFLLNLGSLFAQETDDAKCTAVWYVSVDPDLTVRWTGDDRNATMNVTLSTNDTYGRNCKAKETFIVPFDKREVKHTGFCTNAFYQIEMVLTCDRFSKRQTSTVTTLPDALKIYSVTTTNTTLEAKWHKPVGPIRGYEICLILETSWIRFNKVHCSESLTSEFTDLLPYTVYAVTGSSFNQNGARSSWSNIEKARTEVGVPHAPANLTAVDVTKESVTLEWEEPVPSTGPVEHYIVTWTEGKEYTLHGILPTPAPPRNTSDTSFVFGSLLPFTVYHAQVSAVTSVGQGPPSAIKVKTLLEVPDPPEMKLEGIQNTSISVSWVPSYYYRGPRPTYSLRWKAKGGSYTMKNLEDSSDENQYTITGLTPYTVYEVQVRSNNDAGVGRWSEAQDAQTDVGAPSVPRNLRAQSTFARNVTVEWDEPDPPNGPVSQIRYLVAWRRKTQIAKTSRTENTRFQATDLDPYTDYDFMVQAESSVGESSWTRSLQVKTGIGIPSAPLNLKETGRSNTSIGIQWEAPKRKNGPNVTYFGMWIGNMRAGVSSTAYMNGTDYVIQGLLPYTNYTITVRAVTSAGMGGNSNSILVRTLAGIPSVPKDVRTVEVNPTNITLEWQEPTQSGGSLDGYVLHWGIQDTEGSLLRTTEDFYQAVGLRPYTRYFFKIAAETEGGMSPSTTVYERTAPSVPSVPRYFTFTQVTDHCILLKWSPPEQPNGPNVQYTVRWRMVSPESKAQMEQLSDASYRIKDLKPSTNYSVEVSASTMVGRGPWTETFYIETEQKDYSSAKTAGAVVGSLLLIIAISVAALLLVAKKKGGLQNIISIRRKKKTPATSSETLESSVSSLPMNVLSDSETVDVRNFDQHVLKLMANGYYKLAQEFEKLGKESPAFPSNEARKSDNLTKNRWVKILPFDHTRVKLLPVGDEVEHDFINASYVPGDSHLLEYIATQGPLSNTVNDFWRMAWQESVFTIVMLTQCVERAKRTCERYWPSAGETQTYGQIEVKCISESITPAYIVRIFLVSQEGKQRHIVHLHYMNWPVSGCPKSPDDFLSFIKTVRGQISCAVTGPMIVHCSAGIGRTGTFIAVDRLCQQIEHGSETVDIYGTVLEMRRHRANMVQTEEQYYFIYLCMQRIVQEKRQELENDYGAGIYSN